MTFSELLKSKTTHFSVCLHLGIIFAVVGYSAKRVSFMISVIRSGIDTALNDLGVTSNNIANAKTTGFKKRQATLQMFTAILMPLRLPVRGLAWGL